MLHNISVCWAVILQHILDQIDAATRAIKLITKQHICWAGRGAKAAVDAITQNALCFGNRRIG